LSAGLFYCFPKVSTTDSLCSGLDFVCGVMSVGKRRKKKKNKIQLSQSKSVSVVAECLLQNEDNEMQQRIVSQRT
jgi:hypothetical protein